MNHKCNECGTEFEKAEYLPPEYHMGPDFFLCPECGNDITNQVSVRSGSMKMVICDHADHLCKPDGVHKCYDGVPHQPSSDNIHQKMCTEKSKCVMKNITVRCVESV